MTHGVLFDLDETLIDRAASIVAYAVRFHHDFKNDISTSCDLFVAEFARLDGNGYVNREQFFESLAHYVSAPQISSGTIAAHFAENAWKQPILMAGARECLLDLRRTGVPVGIVTNGGSRNQRQKLSNTGLDRLVDHVVVSEEFGAKKPDPAIFLACCRALEIDPAGSWFVGDNPVLDIAAAGAVGFRTIWLMRSVAWPTDRARGYTHAVSSLQEALDAIRTSGGFFAVDLDN